MDTLKYYVDKGFVVKKIHKILEFKEERCFEQPMEILSNAELEALRLGDGLWVGLLKKVLCSIYGYLLHKNRNYFSMKPCISKSDGLKLIAHHKTTDVQIINDKLTYFHMSQQTLKYSIALICGFQVLQRVILFIWHNFRTCTTT